MPHHSMLTRRRCQIRMDPLQTLPESLVATEILPLLQAHELVKAAYVNRRWRSVCEDERLWQPLCMVRKPYLDLAVPLV